MSVHEDDLMAEAWENDGYVSLQTLLNHAVLVVGSHPERYGTGTARMADALASLVSNESPNRRVYIGK